MGFQIDLTNAPFLLVDAPRKSVMVFINLKSFLSELKKIFNKIGKLIPFDLIQYLNENPLQVADWSDHISDTVRRQIEGFCPWGLREWGFIKRHPALV